jgi:hypothetical protein
MFAGRSAGTTGATAQQIGSTTLTGFNNAIRLQRTAANTSTNDLYIGQSMESLNSIPFAGQTVTFSFYARAGANYSSSGSALAVRLYSGTGTDQSGAGSGFTGSASPISTSQVITTSWVRYSFTAAISSSATQLQFLAFYTPSGTAGAADYVDVTGVMLEVGSQVSPFVRAGGTIQGELAACQRYYFRISGTNSVLASGSAASTTVANFSIQSPVTMRIAPSALEYANPETFDGVSAFSAPSSVVLGWATPTNTTLQFTYGSAILTAFRPMFMSTAGAGYYGLIAEL